MSNAPRYSPPVCTRSGTSNSSLTRRVARGCPSVPPRSTSPLTPATRLHSNVVFLSTTCPDDPTARAAKPALVQWLLTRVTTPVVLSTDTASVSPENVISPETRATPSLPNSCSNLRLLFSVTDTYVCPCATSATPRRARLPPSTRFPCFTVTASMLSTYTVAVRTCIGKATEWPEKDALTSAVPAARPVMTGPFTDAKLSPTVTVNWTALLPSRTLWPLLSSICTCISACS